MANKYLVLAVVATCFLQSCSTSKKASKATPGTWQQTPVTIDGKNDDWPAPYPFFDDKSRLGYSVTNDNDYLYMSLEVGDQLAIVKILNMGLTVTIDPAGGKEQNIAITYPMQSNEEERMSMSRSQSQTGNNDLAKQSRAERVMKAIVEAHAIQFTGLRGGCSGITEVKQKNKCDIETAMGLDSYGSLVWEIKIPFKAFYKQQLTKSDMGKAISICFTTTGMARPAGSSGGNPGAGGMQHGGGGMGHGGGMGGHGGGGHGGGMSRGGGAHNTPYSSREQLYTTTHTWVKAGLVYKQ